MPAADCIGSFDGLNDAITLFHANLSSGLQRLEESHAKNFITIDWLQQAVDLLRSSHATVLTLVERLHLPFAGKGEEWIIAYMDETVKLLNVCDALKKGISRLEEYEGLVEVAVEALQQGINSTAQLNRARQVLNACKEEGVRMHQDNRQLVEMRIEAEGRLCLNINDRHVGDRYAKWSGFWGLIYPMKNTTSFISKILLWGLLHMDSSHSSKLVTICSESSWALSIYNLQQSISKQISLRVSQGREDKILLEEFGKLHACLENLFFQVRSLQERGLVRNGVRMSEVNMLRLNSGTLKCGLEALDWHVNDLFDDIVEGRRKLLSALSQSSAKML